MLSDHQNKQLDVEYSFDIIIISSSMKNGFSKEALVDDSITLRSMLKYYAYQNGTSDMAEGKRVVAYYNYAVYMGVTDYNSLREMLGLMPVVLHDDQYLIHIPNRVYQEIKDMIKQLQNSLHIGLDFVGFQTERFA